jgi:hypothetical protein
MKTKAAPYINLMHSLYEPFEPIDDTRDITDVIHAVWDRLEDLTSLARERSNTCAAAGLDRLAADFKFIALGLQSIPSVLSTANIRRLDKEIKNGQKTGANLLELVMNSHIVPRQPKAGE